MRYCHFGISTIPIYFKLETGSMPITEIRIIFYNKNMSFIFELTVSIDNKSTNHYNNTHM